MPNDAVRAIERPNSALLTLYIVRSILSGPAALVLLPLYYFRYVTMRYCFDDEGVTMRWGILFRREVRLTYARIQDLHIVSGIIQRWLGLADIHAQTAAGSATAEMVIEGLKEHELVRDALYERMRGARAKPRPAQSSGADAQLAGTNAEVVALLREAVSELRGAREALERSQNRAGAAS